MINIENPIVIDSLWRVNKEPKIIGECAGCGEDIYNHQDWYEFEETNDKYLIHQDSVCCWHFVSDRSRCCGPEK